MHNFRRRSDYGRNYQVTLEYLVLLDVFTHINMNVKK